MISFVLKRAQNERLKHFKPSNTNRNGFAIILTVLASEIIWCLLSTISLEEIMDGVDI